MTVATAAASLGLIAFGMFSWTFGEYVIHRWMHEMLGKGLDRGRVGARECIHGKFFWLVQLRLFLACRSSCQMPGGNMFSCSPGSRCHHPYYIIPCR